MHTLTQANITANCALMDVLPAKSRQKHTLPNVILNIEVGFVQLKLFNEDHESLGPLKFFSFRLKLLLSTQRAKFLSLDFLVIRHL